MEKKFVIEFLSDAFNLRLIKEEEGRNKLARTHYSDTVAKVDEEVKSSNTRTSVRDMVKNL